MNALTARSRNTKGPAGVRDSRDAGLVFEMLAPQDRVAALLAGLRRHPELDQETLCYHLQQAEATAAHGCWHASVNEARSFLEGLMASIAAAESRKRDMPIPGTPKNGDARSGYVECRKYLGMIGFAAGEEEELFKHVYSLASRRGSHPGVTDESWGRLVCHLCWTTSHHLLTRYGLWKSHGRRWPEGTTGPRGPSSSNGSWWRRLRGLVTGRARA